MVVGVRRPAASVWWLHQPSLVTCCIVVTLLAQCGASATPNHWPRCPKARPPGFVRVMGEHMPAGGPWALGLPVWFGMVAGMRGAVVGWGARARCRRPAAPGRGETWDGRERGSLRPDLRSMRQAGRRLVRAATPSTAAVAVAVGRGRSKAVGTDSGSRARKGNRPEKKWRLPPLSLSLSLCRSLR
jgi:hypothetical protein